MKYNAVILAGGRGRRLMPMTASIPKPLAPIAGRSAFFRILDLLYAHGVTDCAVTVGYLAEKLMAKRHEHVKCTFFREETPLGTAGGVKNAESMLCDTFIVISGDALCDFDLTDAVKKHKQSGAKVTILLTECPAPFEYGTVDTDKDGYVLSFVEKPSPSQLIGTRINSGIYILEKSVLEFIPSDTPFDFSEDLFPLLLSRGEKIFTVTCEGYWCDIGDLQAYFNCNCDSWNGMLKLYVEARRLGLNVELGKNSVLFDAVVHDNVRIGERARVYSSIICDGAVVGNDCVIKEGCIVGQNATLDDGVVLESGTIAKPDERIFARCGTILGGDTGIYDGVITLARPSAEFLTRLGFALSALGKRVGVISSGAARYFAECVLLGIRGAGITAVDMGIGNSADLRFGIRQMCCDCAVSLSYDKDTLRLFVFDNDTLPPTRKAERRIGELFLSEPSYSSFKSVVHYASARHRRAYINALTLTLGEPIDAISVSDDGDELSFSGYGHYPLLYLALYYISSVPGKIALAPNVPTPITDMLIERGCDVLTIARTPTNERELYARSLAKEQYFLRDGEVLRLLVGALVRSFGKDLESVLKTKVPFCAASEVVDSIHGSVAAIVGKLLKRADCHGKREGVCITFDGGEVTVTPMAHGFKVLASALASETAAELCDTTRSILESL